MAQEAGELGPTIWVDHRKFRAAAVKVDGGGAVLERGRGIVKTGCPRADNTHPAALEFGKVNRFRRMRITIARQRILNDVRHNPASRAFHASGEHDIAGKQCLSRSADQRADRKEFRRPAVRYH